MVSSAVAPLPPPHTQTPTQLAHSLPCAPPPALHTAACYCMHITSACSVPCCVRCCAGTYDGSAEPCGRPGPCLQPPVACSSSVHAFRDMAIVAARRLCVSIPGRQVSRSQWPTNQSPLAVPFHTETPAGPIGTSAVTSCGGRAGGLSANGRNKDHRQSGVCVCVRGGGECC